jgi:small subunit ribosomal protein S34
MLGNVWTECTFRGRTFPEAQNIGAIAFKDDFRLIHKHEEEAFCNRGKARLEPPHILPRTGALPPLWRVREPNI